MSAHHARAGGAYRPTATRLLDELREGLRFHHYACKTEQTYIRWILRFIRFNGTRHPADMGKREIGQFLSHLAINRTVSVSTRRQAMNAIRFLYWQVLDLPVADELTPVRRREQKRLRAVLDRGCVLIKPIQQPLIVKPIQEICACLFIVYSNHV